MLKVSQTIPIPNGAPETRIRTLQTGKGSEWNNGTKVEFEHKLNVFRISKFTGIKKMWSQSFYEIKKVVFVFI